MTSTDAQNIEGSLWGFAVAFSTVSTNSRVTNYIFDVYQIITSISSPNSAPLDTLPTPGMAFSLGQISTQNASATSVVGVLPRLTLLTINGIISLYNVSVVFTFYAPGTKTSTSLGNAITEDGSILVGINIPAQTQQATSLIHRNVIYSVDVAINPLSNPGSTFLNVLCDASQDPTSTWTPVLLSSPSAPSPVIMGLTFSAAVSNISPVDDMPNATQSQALYFLLLDNSPSNGEYFFPYPFSPPREKQLTYDDLVQYANEQYGLPVGGWIVYDPSDISLSNLSLWADASTAPVANIYNNFGLPTDYILKSVNVVPSPDPPTSNYVFFEIEFSLGSSGNSNPRFYAYLGYIPAGV